MAIKERALYHCTPFPGTARMSMRIEQKRRENKNVSCPAHHALLAPLARHSKRLLASRGRAPSSSSLPPNTTTHTHTYSDYQVVRTLGSRPHPRLHGASSWLCHTHDAQAFTAAIGLHLSAIAHNRSLRLIKLHALEHGIPPRSNCALLARTTPRRANITAPCPLRLAPSWPPPPPRQSTRATASFPPQSCK